MANGPLSGAKQASLGESSCLQMTRTWLEDSQLEASPLSAPSKPALQTTIVFSILSEIGTGARLAGGVQSCWRVRQRHRSAQVQLWGGRQDHSGQSRSVRMQRFRVGLQDAA